MQSYFFADVKVLIYIFAHRPDTEMGDDVFAGTVLYDRLNFLALGF